MRCKTQTQNHLKSFIGLTATRLDFVDKYDTHCTAVKPTEYKHIFRRLSCVCVCVCVCMSFRMNIKLNESDSVREWRCLCKRHTNCLQATTTGSQSV